MVTLSLVHTPANVQVRREHLERAEPQESAERCGLAAAGGADEEECLRWRLGHPGAPNPTKGVPQNGLMRLIRIVFFLYRILIDYVFLSLLLRMKPLSVLDLKHGFYAKNCPYKQSPNNLS